MAAITSYCAIEDLGRYGMSAAALKGIDASDKQAAIDGASAMMDSFFRDRFTLPLQSIGVDVKRCCAIIACYDLLATRGMNPEGADEVMRMRYKDQQSWLQAVAGGKILPAVADSSPTSGVGSVTASARVASSSQRGYSRRGSTPTGGGGAFGGD